MEIECGYVVHSEESELTDENNDDFDNACMPVDSINSITRLAKAHLNSNTIKIHHSHWLRLNLVKLNMDNRRRTKKKIGKKSDSVE